MSMITYCVDIYRSRPIGASLLTTSPQQGCLALKGLHTGWLGVVTGAAAIAERQGLSSVSIMVQNRDIVTTYH